MILNESKFDGIVLSINDEFIEDNEFILAKNKKVTIPLTWVISSKNIYMQFNKNSEKFLIYDKISDVIQFDELSSSEIKEKEKLVENIKNSLEEKLNVYEKINLHHPKYKDYVSTYIMQRFNKKESKLINVKNQNDENISFYLDYCSYNINIIKTIVKRYIIF